MFSQWPSQKLLTERSLVAFMFSIKDIAIRLAAFGHIEQSIELLSLSNAYCSSKSHYIQEPALYFACETIDKWPAFVPPDHRTPEYLSGVEKESPLGDRHEMFQLYDELRPPQLKRNADYLKRLLRWMESGTRRLFTYTLEGNDEWYMSLSTQFVVLLALEIAFDIGGHEAEITRLQEVMKADLDTFIPLAAKSRRLWALLRTGFLEPEGSKKEIDAEFNRVKNVLEQLLDSGVQRPFKDQSMEKIIHTIDENTRRRDYEEGEIDLRFLRDQQQPNNVEKDSILHHPASAQSIAALETRLNTVLPEDYKEFLGITDGMNTVWDGFCKMSFVASSFMVKSVPDYISSLITPCQLVPFEELPSGFEVDWPPVDFEYVIQLHDQEYGDLDGTWLVRPEMAKKAVETFLERIENENDEETKKNVEQIVTNYFGGMEQLRAIDWLVMRWTEFDVLAWGSFREFLETLVSMSD